MMGPRFRLATVRVGVASVRVEGRLVGVRWSVWELVDGAGLLPMMVGGREVEGREGGTCEVEGSGAMAGVLAAEVSGVDLLPEAKPSNTLAAASSSSLRSTSASESFTDEVGSERWSCMERGEGIGREVDARLLVWSIQYAGIGMIKISS